MHLVENKESRAGELVSNFTQNMVKSNLCACTHSPSHIAVCLQLPPKAVNGSLYFKEKNVVGCKNFEILYFSYVWNVSYTLATFNITTVCETFTYNDECSSLYMEKSAGRQWGDEYGHREEVRWRTGTWKKPRGEARVGSKVWRRIRIKQKAKASNKYIE